MCERDICTRVGWPKLVLQLGVAINLACKCKYASALYSLYAVKIAPIWWSWPYPLLDDFLLSPPGILMARWSQACGYWWFQAAPERL